MRGAAALVMVLVVVGVPSAGRAADPTEVEILGAYLAQFDDATVQGQHCRRQGGPSATLADTRVDLPANNALLAEHVRWHDTVDSRRNVATYMLDNDPYGDQFREFHRHMILEYDTWRAAQGFEPVAIWDPGTPVPERFLDAVVPAAAGPAIYVAPQATLALSGVLCLPHKSEDPNLPLPTWASLDGGDEASPLFGYRALCEFPSVNRLGKAIDAIGQSYHSDVHNAILGDMGPVWSAPRDPLFWAWHKFLEVQFQAWEELCAARLEATTTVPGQRSVPGASALLGLGVLAVAALATRRR